MKNNRNKLLLIKFEANKNNRNKLLLIKFEANTFIYYLGTNFVQF